jgi:phage baseplate assembly protein W
MKTFALNGRDLSLTGSGYTMVEGISRVKQQLGLGLRESYGGDRFHPRWGSVLPEWIGTVIDRPGMSMEIRSEVIRVIKNFMSVQTAEIDARAARGLSPVVRPSEVVLGVTDVRVTQLQDTVSVTVYLQTAGGQVISVSSGGPNGNNG